MKNWVKIQAAILGLGFFMVFAGCGKESQDTLLGNTESGEGKTKEDGTVSGSKQFDKTEPDNTVFKDKLTLYENEDNTSIITMYLTVSKGNSTESTNHTWNEVNSYSVYDYEEMGIERYGVEGLLQVGKETEPSEGELGYGQSLPNATVTIRGQTSSRNPRKSYKIKIKDGKGEWRGQKIINLNKHQTDGVRFRNKLAYDLLKGMPGMISFRTQFVHLYVKDLTEQDNGKFVDYGLYTQVEQPNKTFLKNHGLDSNGYLYKINEFEFYRYEDIIKLKSDADYDLKAFEKRIEIKGNDDHSKLIAMLDDVNDISIPIRDIMDKWFDEENMLTWMAFQILIGNADTQSRNTIIYSPLNVDKWYFIAWDNDTGFTRKEFEIQNRSEEDSWEIGISNYWGNILFRRVLKDEYFKNELHEEIQEIRGLLTEKRIQGMVGEYRKATEEYVYGPSDIVNAPLTKEQYNEVCEAIPKEVEHNYQLYLETLHMPMPFFIGVPAETENGIRFVWENAYDFDAEDIFYSFELADNPEFTNPIEVKDSLFTPEYTYEGTIPPGQYFVRIKAKNTSGKEQYAFDYYVVDNSYKVFGTKCFYINADGSIAEDIYEE